MTRDDRLNRIETKLDEVLERVAQYQGAINVLRWVFGLVTVPTLGALVWVMKKVGIIVT